MTKAEIAKLEKEARASVKPGHIIFKFGYGHKIVVPHAAGLQILEALAQAEVIKDDDYENKAILPMEKGPEILLLSHSAYLEKKMYHLLGLHETEETS